MNTEPFGHTEDSKYLLLLHLRLLCASSLSPPSRHTLPLLFPNLIYFCLFFFPAGFLSNPTTNDRGLSHAPLPRSHPFSHPSLFSPSSSYDNSPAFIKPHVHIIFSFVASASLCVLSGCVRVFSGSQVCNLSVVSPIQSSKSRVSLGLL